MSVPTQQYLNGSYMEEIVHDITTKMRQREKSMTWTNKEEVEGSFNSTKPGNNTMHTFKKIIYLSSVEIWKVCWMRENTYQQYKICTKLVGRHNTSSLLMFQCWVMVVVFHNILSFMIPIFKKSNVTTSICWKICWS